MRLTVRPVLSALAVAFTAYLAVGGLVWTAPIPFPLVHLGALALFLVTTWLCTFWNVRTSSAGAPPLTAGLGRGSLLPGWAAVLALATAVIVPNATWVAVGARGLLEPFGTWSIGGVGALMAIVSVRRRPWIAWAGVAALAITSALWIGILRALELGVVGAVLWVAVAQLVTWLVDRAARDTADLMALQRSASEWLASQEGGRRERRRAIQRALTIAGPVLSRTIEADGELDDDERTQARLAEGRLRDELRGARLLDDAVRVRLEAARRRGAEVTMLDEGGLDGINEAGLASIRAELARILDGAPSERLYIRTSPHDRIAVTVVGRSRHAEPDGEDSVDLWHEIPLPSVGTPVVEE